MLKRAGEKGGGATAKGEREKASKEIVNSAIKLVCFLLNFPYKGRAGTARCRQSPKELNLSDHLIQDCRTAIGFLCGKNATYTIVSKRSGDRITFKTREPQEQRNPARPIFFISALTGSDNETSFAYIGHLSINASGAMVFNRHRKCAPKFAAAFSYVFERVSRSRMPNDIEFWHEGKCCRCGRKLTVPSSIESGIGPECARNVERMAA